MGKLNVNQEYSGFVVNQEVFLKELHANMYTLEHSGSGAQLIYIDCDDTNKVFSISFRTPPNDSTGVFHILEHSVLCGSKKFNVKKPFVELLKGSMNTYLNALTYSDKTMYPVASKNEKDFLNLIDVYMDSVLNPNICEEEDIFKQEGWHYELNDNLDQIAYKGVVYNEMKGVFGSPDAILFNTVNESLFPETIYRHVSGGDPEQITDLSYEALLKAYHQYYHPSNSYIYLYGDMNVEEKLALLHDSYLSKYDKKQIDSSIPLQQPVKDQVVVKAYEILETDTEDHKVHMSLNFVIGENIDRERVLAFEILEKMLLSSHAAPLKNALLAKGIGQNVTGFLNSGIRQPFLSIMVKNAHAGQEEAFKQTVFEELRSLVANGIDKKLIEGAISKSEFRLRETDFGLKGLMYNTLVLNNWLYDGDPKAYLEYEEALETIKSSLTTNYFEQLIEEVLLNSGHNSLAVITPSKTLAAQKRGKESDRLTALRNSLSQDDLKRLHRENEKLIERQTMPDEKENLDSIPMLTLDDLDKQTEPLPCTKINVNNLPVLWHEMNTNQIVYYNLYFDLKKAVSALGEQSIPYLSLLSRFLGKLDTTNYNYNQLSNEIDIEFGSLSFQEHVYESSDAEDHFNAMFTIRAKVLSSRLESSIHYVNDIMNHTIFTNKKRIFDLLQEIKIELGMYINQTGHSYALMRLNSRFSKASNYADQLYGIDFYSFINDILDNFDRHYENLITQLETARNHIFTNEKLVLSCTGDKQQFSLFQQAVAKLEVKEPPVDNRTGPGPESAEKAANEAFIVSSGVSYVTKGYNYRKCGYKYSGKLKVLKRILDLDYLWNAVRVQGGAYGAGAFIRRLGDFNFYSFRDPNVAATFDVYNKASEYLASFAEDEQTMTKYIIGTFAELDRPMSNREKGEESDSNYFSGITSADLEQERQEVLSTTAEDIRSFADLVKAMTEKGQVCVIGNKDKIMESAERFDQVTELKS